MTVSARFCLSLNLLAARKPARDSREQSRISARIRIKIYDTDSVNVAVLRDGTNAHYALSKYLRLKYIGKRADYISGINGVCGTGRIVES